MGRPILIDTDMGVDDAVAVTLALAVPALDVVGIGGVGGNVSCEQATGNIGRLLHALKIKDGPRVGQGLDQNDPDLKDATSVFGADGLGETNLKRPPKWKPEKGSKLYRELIAAHEGELTIIAMGPLTNLAALLGDDPKLLRGVSRVVVMGGAVWCPGNITKHAEFNFYRDASAARAVLSAGCPTTVVPLDVTRQVGLDESHAAHLSASGSLAGELLGRMVAWPLAHAKGSFLVHDAVAVGAVLWPELFLQTQLALDLVLDGEERGRSKPGVARGAENRVTVLISVNVVDFLENMLEALCQEKFVV